MRAFGRTSSDTTSQDILLWMFYRCYSAQTESLIPWNETRQQLPQDDSNPWRLKNLVIARTVIPRHRSLSIIRAWLSH